MLGFFVVSSILEKEIEKSVKKCYPGGSYFGGRIPAGKRRLAHRPSGARKTSFLLTPRKGVGALDIHLILEAVSVTCNVVMTVLAIVNACKGCGDKSDKKM